MKASLLCASCGMAIVAFFPAKAFAQASEDSSVAAQEQRPSDPEIIVTARQRDESLAETPVAVTAIAGADLIRTNANDLSKIAELSPNVIVSNFTAQGGGSISIRGISSPANSLGFEQSVSVSVDGVQTSIGFLATLGYFDVAQVEILKGPQALLFGKNSPAGVISLKTANPTSDFEVSVRGTYEFVADEAIVDAVISGPITDTLGARLAVRGRTMRGWLYNDARRIADNPFIPGPDLGIDGASERRVGDDEIMARATLLFEPGSDTEFNLKIAYDRLWTGGGGVASQTIGACPTGFPNLYGRDDPAGECRPDNHTTNGVATIQTVGDFPGRPDDLKPYGDIEVFAPVLTSRIGLGNLDLTAVTGYSSIHSDSYYSHDQTSFAQIVTREDVRYRAFSQELRLLSDFGGPINFMVGGYYQKQKTSSRQTSKLNDFANFNPANGSYLAFDKDSWVSGHTLSAFGQGIATFGQFELAGGLRWSREKKSAYINNLYGFPATVFVPGKILEGSQTSNNVSPEVTASWRPRPDSTIYVAYRTGYKSGGFNQTAPVQVPTTIDDVSFGPEKAKGGEIGAKGYFLSGRLFLDFNAFAYRFTDLQVNAFNPALISYTTVNAGSVRQRGFELQGKFDVTPDFQLRGNLSYTRNRFKDFVGQCYGYSYPAGDTTSPAPPGCRFRTGTRILEQDFEGRAPARSPDWAASTGLTYAVEMPDDTRLEFNGDAFFTSKYFASETMASSTLQKAFWRFNAGIAYRDADDRWSVSLLGRNLTNRYYLLYAADGTGGTGIPLNEGKQRAVVARGREIAVQASFRF